MDVLTHKFLFERAWNELREQHEKVFGVEAIPVLLKEELPIQKLALQIFDLFTSGIVLELAKPSNFLFGASTSVVEIEFSVDFKAISVTTAG